MLYFLHMTPAIKKVLESKYFYSLVIFAFLFFAVSFLVNVVASVGTTCHTITTPDATPSTFGSPLNFFSGANELLISVTCDGSNATHIEVGSGAPTQYIYMYGYRKVNGKWTRTTFTGSTVTGTWIVGKGGVTVEGVQDGETGQILAYICQNIQNTWKCGCSDNACPTPKWQLQEYRLPAGTVGTGATPNGDGELDVHYPSKYLGLPGETVTLIGSGFETGSVSSILWNGEIQESGVSSETGAALIITIPNLPPGKYEVKVKEGNVVSKYGVGIWIGTGDNSPVPTITSITPESGLQGGTFTVHGTGFTKKNNDAITTFGVLSGLPSEDGKSITFTYDPFDEKLVSYNENAERSEYALPVNVTIMNTSGQSNMKIFNLNI